MSDPGTAEEGDIPEMDVNEPIYYLAYKWVRSELYESQARRIAELESQVLEACDYLRRAGALVAMGGDQEMALSVARNADRIQGGVKQPPEPRAVQRCAATISTDPPQDCDAPFCGCNPEWHKVIAMLQECGWKSPRELRADAEPEATQEKQAMEIKDHGITVHVGDDGAWVCFKTKGGNSFCFQPVQQWASPDSFYPTVDAWARDMQTLRDGPPHKPGCKMFPDPHNPRRPIGPCDCRPTPTKVGSQS